MAICSIQEGFVKARKTKQGGIDKLYLFPYVKYGVSDITFGGGSRVSNPDAQNITSFPQTTIYEYDAVNISYSENATISSGGIEWSQNLSFTLPDSDVFLNAYKLMYKDYCAIFLDRNGNYRIVGLWNGGEVTINAGTGGEKSAMNGSTITLKAREDNQAYFLSNFDTDFDVFIEQLDPCTNPLLTRYYYRVINDGGIVESLACADI